VQVVVREGWGCMDLCCVLLLGHTTKSFFAVSQKAHNKVDIFIIVVHELKLSYRFRKLSKNNTK
jgi:hypothetical protein